MLKSYLKVAVRSLVKDKFFSLINMFGLSIGIASCLLIIIYINNEISYDRFHSKADNIYRINEFIETEGSGEQSSSIPFPTGPTLQEEYSTIIESQVRLFNFQSPTILVSRKEKLKEFNEARVFFADSTFFDVFDYQVIKGNRATALMEANSILLTESMAKKYFGEEDPIGKFLKIQDQQELMVTAVMPDSPLNAHFQFDFIISFSTVKAFFGGNYPQTWYWNPCWTYIVLKDGVAPQDLEREFPEFIQKYFPDFIRDEATMKLQKLTDIHLTSDLEFEIKANSSENNIYVFSIIGAFILIIASMNFMNLSTAKSVKRAKEVGLRKTLGGRREQLIGQFLIESIIVTALSVIIALIIAGFSLPWFNNLAEKSLGLEILFSPVVLIGLLVISIVIGIGAGLYPALILSSFIPIKVLKEDKPKGKGINLRQFLVVLQFTLSISLIIGTVVAINQLNFLKDSDTGFDKEQILYVSVLRTPIANKFKTIKKELEKNNDITYATGVLDVLGAHHQGDNFRFEGMDKSKLYSVFWVRHDFFKTFDLEIVHGRPFKDNITTDDSLALVVNESMVRQLGWEPDDAIGKKYQYNNWNGEIVGVVKDFNFISKHKKIQPLAVQLRTSPFAFNFAIKYLAIKMNSDNFSETLASVEKTWKEFMPGRPFDYFFLDSELDKLYKDEEKLGKVAGIFSTLAIIVAWLGLFALASFIAEERQKEIGIRKVMGSSLRQIVVLLSLDFTKLVIIAFVIACPLAWYSINSWLDSFAYRVDINFFTFLIVGVSTLAIALITISYRAIRAANANPVKTLKYE